MMDVFVTEIVGTGLFVWHEHILNEYICFKYEYLQNIYKQNFVFQN